MAGPRRFTVSGQGYSTEGRIRTTDGSPAARHAGGRAARDGAVHRRDAPRRRGRRRPDRGRPAGARREGRHRHRRAAPGRPRVAEVPFDSDYKFMATFHRWTDRQRPATSCAASSRAPRTCWPRRADRYLGGDAGPPPRRGRCGRATTRGNAELAEQGMRVLAVGAAGLPGRGRRRPPTTRRTCWTGSCSSRSSASSTRPDPRRAKAIAQCRQRGHPGPDDHRRPRGDRRRHRRRARHPGPGGHRRGTGSDRRRRRARPRGSTTSAWSPASRPSTRSASCARCRPAATSSP